MGTTGYIALFLALITAAYSAFAFVYGAKGRRPGLLDSARNGLITVCALNSISVAIMLGALITGDFRLEYVASYTNRDLSLIYRISALWAGNAGSLLFWAWLLSVFGAVAAFQKRDYGREMVPYASAVTMSTVAFFLLLLVAVSNPFVQMSVAPADGRGLNPLLENPGMIIHPPALLAGYVGFTIPFAFAVAALVTRKLDDRWLAVVRRWTLLPWLLLGAGNLIGAWWAYVELGWGGYWAWDPVENAGLMPWLVATAFLHSSIMQRRRGTFKVWSLLLIILTFTLAIFGTFLTRSGILSSLHTFGESGLGPFFLTFISVALFGSLWLVYSRWEDLKIEPDAEELVSRDSTFLLNNMLLLGATGLIFLGTIFPVLIGAVRGVQMIVGPAFYNKVSTPLFLAVILLAGLCTLIGWKRASLKNLGVKLAPPAAVAVIVLIALLATGVRQWYAAVAFPVCGFVVTAVLSEWSRETAARRRASHESWLRAFSTLIFANRPRYGGYIIHIAVVLIAAGVIGSSLFAADKEVTLKPGESTNINQYTLTYEGLKQSEIPSKTVVTATISVFNGGDLLGKLTPEKYFHQSFDQPVTEVAIRSNLKEDLYVILMGWDQNGASFKVLVNPMISWLWIGGGVFLLGGLFAFWPSRRSTTQE